MADIETMLENMTIQAVPVVGRIVKEGGEVPDWALEQVELSTTALAEYRQGEDYRPALDAVIQHGNEHRAEQEAFFSKKP